MRQTNGMMSQAHQNFSATFQQAGSKTTAVKAGDKE